MTWPSSTVLVNHPIHSSVSSSNTHAASMSFCSFVRSHVTNLTPTGSTAALPPGALADLFWAFAMPSLLALADLEEWIQNHPAQQAGYSRTGYPVSSVRAWLAGPDRSGCTRSHYPHSCGPSLPCPPAVPRRGKT